MKNISIGLIVDGVAEVVAIPETEIVAPPEINQGGRKYINGIGKFGNNVKLLIDCGKMLNDGEVEALSLVS